MTDPMKFDDSSDGRKTTPVYSGVVRYFPAALALVSKVSKFGSEKHGTNMQHRRGVSADHGDCIIRHQTDPQSRDPESNLQHACAVAWRALAQLQEIAEREHGWPVAPAALFTEKDITPEEVFRPRYVPDPNAPRVGDTFEALRAFESSSGVYSPPGVYTVSAVLHVQHPVVYAYDHTAVKFDGVHYVQRTNAPLWRPVVK